MAKHEVSEEVIQRMSVRMLAEPRYQREAALRVSFGDDRQLANGRHMIRVSLREALTTFRACYPRATQRETIQALRDFIEAQPTRRRRAMERGYSPSTCKNLPEAHLTAGVSLRS